MNKFIRLFFREDEHKTRTPRFSLLILLASIIVSTWYGSWCWITNHYDSIYPSGNNALSPYEVRGMFGDMFGAVNALFSGLAFAGLIYAILLQHSELQVQRKELTENTKQLAKQAEIVDSQLELANLPFFEIIRFENDETGIDVKNIGKAAFDVKVTYLGKDNINFDRAVKIRRYVKHDGIIYLYYSIENLDSKSIDFRIEFTSMLRTIYYQDFHISFTSIFDNLQITMPTRIS